MTNSRANKGWELIKKHIATGTEATLDLTGLTLSAADYSQIIIEMDGESTATLNVLLRINGLGTAKYDIWTTTNDGSAMAGSTSADNTSHQLVALGGANRSFSLQAIITIAETSGIVYIHSNSMSFGGGGYVDSFGANDTGSITSITGINIFTSTSTWKSTTKISIYGVRR